MDANTNNAKVDDEESDQERKKQEKQDKLENDMERVLAKKNACIVVLGDIGRSPRMRYHALSLANEGFNVNMIGYGGSELPEVLANNPNIWFTFMREPPELLQGLPKPLAYPLKVIWQWIFLFWAFIWMTLGRQFYPDYILVQNPPAIPTLMLCWLNSILLWCHFVVDWHNYGYSIMAMNVGENSLIYKVSKWIEEYFGAKGHGHLCVSNAMKADLKNRLNINAITLYDRASEIFKPLNEDEKFEFLRKMSSKYPSLNAVWDPSLKKPTKILISSTSWTEDEDFNILLTSLEDYEQIREENPSKYPYMIVFITGKGPLKEFYKNKIFAHDWKNLEINLPWLDPEDYPKLLACSDLGVSLHTSSSGVDLPMKVVDMFGCGLPVCAYNFECISELVIHNENGFIFNTSYELSQYIQDWFKISQVPNLNHTNFKNNLKKFQSLRWEENWNRVARPLFQRD